MIEPKIAQARFTHGQPVKFASTTSARVFRGVVDYPIADGFYYWVTDGTESGPRIVRANRLQADPRIT